MEHKGKPQTFDFGSWTGLSLHSDIVFVKKVDLIGNQYFERSKPNFAQGGLFIRNFLIKKEKDIFSILDFGIEV